MKKRLLPSKNALLSSSGFTTLLLIAWCAPTIAATGVDVESPESERQSRLVGTNIDLPELVLPILNIDVADHGVDSSADIEDEIVDAPLTSQAVSSGEEIDDAAAEVKEADTTLDDPAPTATTRLPGVSETDQPRYRRQMYRTDI